MTCIQCHVRINESANYCENCGAKVSSVKKRYHQVVESEVLDELTKTIVNNRGQNMILIGLLTLCVSTLYYFILGVVVKFT